MEKQPERQTGAGPRTALVEQINACLRSGDYTRALEVFRGAAADLSKDAQLSELEKLAHDGVTRLAEANRLITESQELFAQGKSAEALQILRKAYELDKRNSLARSILANALVEHAQSVVETDWLEAETLANQALQLNPEHPTAKTIHSQIMEQKKNSSVEDWVERASALQSSGDLFKALVWVAEGLAVHPDDPKLLQVHESIQRDQGARRRQARRGDVEELRRMELAIDEAADANAKQALAERIQDMAARYWTDGEILSVANRLLHRLGFAPNEVSPPSATNKAGTVIFHVPRPGAQEMVSSTPVGDIAASRTSQGSIGKTALQPNAPPQNVIPAITIPVITASEEVAPAVAGSRDTAPHAIELSGTAAASSAAETDARSGAATVPSGVTQPIASQPVVSVVSANSDATCEPFRDTPLATSNSKVILYVCAAAVVLVAATFFITRRHYALPATGQSPPSTGASAPQNSTPASSPPPQPLTTEKPPEAIPLAAPASSSIPGAQAPVEKHAPDHQPADDRPADDQPAVNRHNADRPSDNRLAGGSRTEDRRSDEAQPAMPPQPQSVQPQIAQTAVAQTLNVQRIAPADAVLEAAPGAVTISFSPPDATVVLVKGEVLKMVSSGATLNLPGGTYTLTARTAERFTRTGTVEILPGQSKTLNLSLAPTSMAKWDAPASWKQEKDSFVRKGGDFVLYGAAPASGTFVFSAMLTKGRLLQWVLDYTDSRNYVLCQMDEENFYRSVIRNGQKTSEIKVPERADKKNFRALQIRVGPTELVQEIKHGNHSTVLDRWTQPGVDFSQGKFGFYIPGDDQITVSNFAYYADLNVH